MKDIQDDTIETAAKTYTINHSQEHRLTIDKDGKINVIKTKHKEQAIDNVMLDDAFRDENAKNVVPKISQKSLKQLDDIGIEDLENDDEYKSRGTEINMLYCAALLFLFLLIFLIFISVIYVKAIQKEKTRTIITKSDIAIRGSIFSNDGYLLSSSEKLYSLSFSPLFINPNKKELFVNLLSIYSGISKSSIEKAFNSNNSYVRLSTQITPDIAANLEQLNTKLLRLGVFRNLQDENNRILRKRGLDIEVYKINRIYPLGTYLEPILGYIRESSGERIKRIEGVKGVEKYRDDILSAKRDGKITGKRDVGGNIILSKDAQVIEREDGFNIKLNISLSLQTQVEKILYQANEKYRAGEIIAAIINPFTGEINAIASSNVYNPNIGKRGGNEVLKLMNASVVERVYEPGSTIKPLIFSYLLDKNLINLNNNVNVENGIYKLRSYTIKDSIPFDILKTKDVLIRSSNIGMVKLTKDLGGVEIQNIFKTFKLGSQTGVDIAYEKSGFIPKSNILNREVEKAAASYGYGVEVTFMQLLRAYSSFVNGGMLVTPYIAHSFTSPSGVEYAPKLEENTRVLSRSSADIMKTLLHEAVVNGTGKNANVKGLIIGGKTGTAHIAQKGEYKNLYNGSFFGYASDGDRTFVIGVVAFESHSDEDYYGGRTAAPIFAKIAESLADNNFLTIK